MAKKALMKIGDRYTEVDAANPDLPPHGEYYCSGTCDGGKMCMCPVTLIVPDDGDIVRHFRRTQQNVSHGKGCTHADESPFRFVDHLDHSGADMIDQDILKLGSRHRGQGAARRSMVLGENTPERPHRTGKLRTIIGSRSSG